MPPCKHSGRYRFRRWRHGSPGSGTPWDTVPFHSLHSLRRRHHRLLSSLAPRRQAMTPFLRCCLKMPVCPASPCHRKRHAAYCGSCVYPMRPCGPIAQDVWSFQGEWPMCALNLTVWPCKRSPLSPSDDFSAPGKKAGQPHNHMQPAFQPPAIRAMT